MFNFKKQLNIGNKGEDFFLKCYQLLNPVASETRAIDFIINTKESVELKTDMYKMEKSENFFMEKFGNVKSIPQSLGGPWRALRDKIDFFVYLYFHDKTFFWFEPATLCKFLDKSITAKNARYIRNEGWTAIGYLVARESVEHLCIRKDVFDKNGRAITSI